MAKPKRSSLRPIFNPWGPILSAERLSLLHALRGVVLGLDDHVRFNVTLRERARGRIGWEIDCGQPVYVRGEFRVPGFEIQGGIHRSLEQNGFPDGMPRGGALSIRPAEGGAIVSVLSKPGAMDGLHFPVGPDGYSWISSARFSREQRSHLQTAEHLALACLDLLVPGESIRLLDKPDLSAHQKLDRAILLDRLGPKLRRLSEVLFRDMNETSQVRVERTSSGAILVSTGGWFFSGYDPLAFACRSDSSSAPAAPAPAP